MQRLCMPQPAQALGQLQVLGRVVAEQQGALQVKAFRLGAIQALVDVGTGQVVMHGRRAEQQYALGVLQRGEELAGLLVQQAQVARQALEHFLALATCRWTAWSSAWGPNTRISRSRQSRV